MFVVLEVDEYEYECVVKKILRLFRIRSVTGAYTLDHGTVLQIQLLLTSCVACHASLDQFFFFFRHCFKTVIITNLKAFPLQNVCFFCFFAFCFSTV